jgi:thiamine kinase-like enzyme
MSAAARVRALPIWSGPVDPVPLDGGITNVNFSVQDGPRRVVVRVGTDIPVHHVMRFNELAASRAAHAAGISPGVLYHEHGILVLDWIEGHSLTAADVAAPGMLDRILPLILRCHREIPNHLRGPSLVFWVHHVIRDYAATLREGGSRHTAALPDLLAQAAKLERATGAIDLVFGHNDLLPANLMVSADRVWLIDWDYAGWNSPLFDLGGLAANCGLTVAQEHWLLERYFDRPVTPDLLRRYRATKAAAALREALWSMVSEIHSDLAIDFAAYTEKTLTAWQAAYDDFTQS